MSVELIAPRVREYFNRKHSWLGSLLRIVGLENGTRDTVLMTAWRLFTVKIETRRLELSQSDLLKD